MGAEQFEVAILAVGLPRTMGHAAVAASFHLIRSSLTRAGHNVSVLLWLSATTKNGVGGHASVDKWKRSWPLVYGPMYSAARVWVSDETIPCNPSCRHLVGSCEANGPTFPGTMFRRYEITGKIVLAISRLQEFERERCRSFDWVLRTRPDLLYLQPLPKLSTLNPSYAYVPPGICNDGANFNPLANDHLILCPRGIRNCMQGELDIHRYWNCTMTWNKTDLNPANLERFVRHFNMTYTIARAGSHGPECERLAFPNTWSFQKRLLDLCRAYKLKWDVLE